MRLPEKGFDPGDDTSSGGSYDRWKAVYVVAPTSASAGRQAKLMVGYSEEDAQRRTALHKPVKLELLT